MDYMKAFYRKYQILKFKLIELLLNNYNYFNLLIYRNRYAII